MLIYPLIIPAVTLLMALPFVPKDRTPRFVHPTPGLVLLGPTPPCRWHRYEEERIEHEVCGDQTTGRTRNARPAAR